MDATEVSEALVEWALATCPELQGGYAYPPTGKNTTLPDVVAGVDSEEEKIVDERFPWSQLQQTGVRIFDCTLSIMAEQDIAPEPGPLAEDPGKVATDQLRGMVRALMDAKRPDATLGDRVFDTDVRIRADYEPGFVEYADGSRGREVRISLTVAEPLEASTT